MEKQERSAPTPELRTIRTQLEDEFLVKVGAKKEEIDWHPLIVSRRTERPKSSSTSINYPIDFRLGRPKSCRSSFNRNPWSCGNQALRQMTMVTKYGPRRIFFTKSHVTNILEVHYDENGTEEQVQSIDSPDE